MSAAWSIRTVRITALVLCVFGAAVLAWQFVRFLVVFPGPALLAAALELPLLVGGFALARLLRPVHAPSLRWSAAALTWGATAAAGCALLANRGLISLWAKGAGTRFAATWSAALSAPLNEEILKLCGVVMVILAAPLVIRGPLDGLIFGAITGLGFQAIENVTYGLNSIVLSGATDPARAVLNSALLRVGTTGLGSHWTMTAVAGAGIGYLVQSIRAGSWRPGSWRGGALPALACLATGMAMHLLFDAPAPAIPIKVVVNLVLVGALYLLLRSAYRSRARDALAAREAAGLVTRAESEYLLSRRHRRRRLRSAQSPAERGVLRARQHELLTEVDSEAA